MPRGGRRSASPMGNRRPVQRAPPPRAQPPATVPQPASGVTSPQPRQPGMFAQMASTAAGVAVGSAVGHTLGAAMTGGGGGGGQQEADVTYQEQAAPMQQQQQQQQQMNSCQYEFEQLLRCTQGQSDISLCQGFSDVLKECKMRYGVQ